MTAQTFEPNMFKHHIITEMHHAHSCDQISIENKAKPESVQNQPPQLINDTETNESTNSKYKSKKKMKKIKYPPSAFLLFCKDFRLKIHQKCPGLSPIDLTRLLSQLWKYLEPEIKQSYLQKRQKIIDDFVVDHPNYNGETSVDIDENTTIQKTKNNYYPLINSNRNQTNTIGVDIDINHFLSHFQVNKNDDIIKRRSKL